MSASINIMTSTVSFKLSTKGELSKKNHPVLEVSTHWTTPNK